MCAQTLPTALVSADPELRWTPPLPRRGVGVLCMENPPRRLLGRQGDPFWGSGRAVMQLP